MYSTSCMNAGRMTPPQPVHELAEVNKYVKKTLAILRPGKVSNMSQGIVHHLQGYVSTFICHEIQDSVYLLSP